MTGDNIAAESAQQQLLQEPQQQPDAAAAIPLVVGLQVVPAAAPPPADEFEVDANFHYQHPHQHQHNNNNHANNGSNKLFSFGAIADVQYADCVDGWNWNGTIRRYFRGALTQLRQAVDFWLQEERHRYGW